MREIEWNSPTDGAGVGAYRDGNGKPYVLPSVLVRASFGGRGARKMCAVMCDHFTVVHGY
jgi:hypothetical protein